MQGINKVPDRQELRREYLRKKSDAHASGTLCWLLLFVTLSITILCSGIGVVICVKLLGRGDLAIETRSSLEEALVGAIISAPLAGFCSWHLWKGVKGANDRARLPYVPPVTTSSLPTQEVLVRGADQPAAPQETLLRATVKDEETAPAQLLRVASGAKEESK